MTNNKTSGHMSKEAIERFKAKQFSPEEDRAAEERLRQRQADDERKQRENDISNIFGKDGLPK